jgi:hypothetical protein
MNKNIKFVKKLYDMKVGDKFRLIIGTEEEGVFIRIPSGWIYRYALRNCCTSCFIPYTEDINYWDTSMELKKCHWCNSTDVIVSGYQSNDENSWFVKCSSCGASSPIKKNKDDAILTWNKFK